MPSVPNKAYPFHLILSCVQFILSEIFYLGWNLCVLLVGHVHVVEGEAVAQLVAERSLHKKKNQLSQLFCVVGLERFILVISGFRIRTLK